MTVERERLRTWLRERLAQPNIRARLGQFASICEEFSAIPAEAMTEADLGRIWLDVRNGVSELPSTSANLYNAQRPAVLRVATAIAQRLSEPPGARLIDLHRFFRLNGEPTSQLTHYVRAAALFDPGHVPTVNAYRALPGTMMAALGYSGPSTPWEQLIQEERAAQLDSAFAFAFGLIENVLPEENVYARAIALELVPGYVKDQARLEGKPIMPRAAYVAPPPAPSKPAISERGHRQPGRSPRSRRERGPGS